MTTSLQHAHDHFSCRLETRMDEFVAAIVWLKQLHVVVLILTGFMPGHFGFDLPLTIRRCPMYPGAVHAGIGSTRERGEAMRRGLLLCCMLPSSYDPSSPPLHRIRWYLDSTRIIFPDTDRIWASTEEDLTEQATVSSAMHRHRARALLVPPQQGEGRDCWAIRHGEYKRSTDSYAHHDHGARRRDRQSIRIRQAVLRSRSASYDNRPREYDERGFSGIREKGIAAPQHQCRLVSRKTQRSAPEPSHAVSRRSCPYKERHPYIHQVRAFALGLIRPLPYAFDISHAASYDPNGNEEGKTAST
ncbi:hypothetical protein B0H13DRAFT_2527404 [Mycena leptocephala]|nr:hypothetical protein B0H13DRAFT_2527404 [Mycena leptocephala]